MAGLTYEIRVKTEFDVTTDPGDVSISQRIDLSVVKGEAAIPCDDVLTAGRQPYWPKIGSPRSLARSYGTAGGGITSALRW